MRRQLEPRRGHSKDPEQTAGTPRHRSRLLQEREDPLADLVLSPLGRDVRRVEHLDRCDVGAEGANHPVAGVEQPMDQP